MCVCISACGHCVYMCEWLLQILIPLSWMHAYLMRSNILCSAIDSVMAVRSFAYFERNALTMLHVTVFYSFAMFFRSHHICYRRILESKYTRILNWDGPTFQWIWFVHIFGWTISIFWFIWNASKECQWHFENIDSGFWVLGSYPTIFFFEFR